MSSCAPAASEHAHRVGVIHHHPRAELLGKRKDLRQGSDIAFHAKQTIHHQQFARFFRQTSEYPFEMLHVVVAVAFNFATAQDRPVDDTGVILLIQNHNVPASNQRTDRPQVHLHAGRENQGCFLANPVSQFFFQLFDDGHVAVQEP